MLPENSGTPIDSEISTGEKIYINVSDSRVGVLLYYAVLAYPDARDSLKRRAFVEAMAARQVKELSRQIGSRENIPKFYTSFKNEKIQDAFRRGCTRLARRFSAGTIGWSIRVAAQTLAYDVAAPDGPKFLLLTGAKTLNSAIRAYVENKESRTIDWDDHSLANAKHRVWAESLPVLHLAMTNPIVVKIIQEQLNTGKKIATKRIDTDIFDSIIEPAWLADSLDEAESLRPILGQELGTKPGHPTQRGFLPERALRLLPTSHP